MVFSVHRLFGKTHVETTTFFPSRKVKSWNKMSDFDDEIQNLLRGNFAVIASSYNRIGLTKEQYDILMSRKYLGSW